MVMPFDEDDLSLDDAQLCDKYGGYWGAHPYYGLGDWRNEVANNHTRCGYWDWVFNQIENCSPDEFGNDPLVGDEDESDLTGGLKNETR